MELHIDITGDDMAVNKIIDAIMSAKLADHKNGGGVVTHDEHTLTHTEHTPTHAAKETTPEEPKTKRHPGRPKKNTPDDEDEALRNKIFG